MLITAERDGYFGLRVKPALGRPWLKTVLNFLRFVLIRPD